MTANQIRKELNKLNKAAAKAVTAHDEDTPIVCRGIGRITHCTDTAVYLAWRLGGKVYGYEYEDNPTAIIGKDEFGHDFTIIDDRWLVDWWAKDTYGYKDLYDLEKPRDRTEVSKLYGPRERWGEMSKQDFDDYVAYIQSVS